MTTGNGRHDHKPAREQDPLVSSVDALFASEAASQAGDEDLVLRITDRAVAAAMTDAGPEAEVPDALRASVMLAFEAEAAPHPGDGALARRIATAALSAAQRPPAAGARAGRVVGWGFPRCCCSCWCRPGCSRRAR